MRVSRRRRVNKVKEARKRKTKKVILWVFLILCVIVLLDLAYLAVMKGRFHHHTTLNGYDVSGKTTGEVMELLKAPYGSLSLSVKEKGEEVLGFSFEEMGYTVNEKQLEHDVEKMMSRQSAIVYGTLIFGNHYGMRVPFEVDQSVFREQVSGSRFTVPRTGTKNAELVEKDGAYRIEPEIYGTELEEEAFRTLVAETIDRELMHGTVERVIEVDVPDSLYKQPTVFADDTELNRLMNIYNQYCKAKITYTFGEEKVLLAWDTIKEWIDMDGTESSVNEDAVYQYVYELAMEYDTIYVPRDFRTSSGTVVTLPSNDYGYQIDQETEAQQLLADIYANTPVEREPVYAISGYSRNGHDDLNGTYVEVDLTNQYLWFYEDGDLVVESPVVTGLPKDGRETAQGAFAIPYKASPFNLVGEGNGPGQSWDVEVQYWMPFHEGQGLHDASWQTSFGGNVYQYNGSHGCVNLPPDVAAVIYNYLEANTAIILYK